MQNPLNLAPALRVRGTHAGGMTRMRALTSRFAGMRGRRLVMFSVLAWFSSVVVSMIAALALSFSIDSSGEINGVFGSIMAAAGALSALAGVTLACLAWILLFAGLAVGVGKRLTKRR